jgi:hypothetical protein
MIVSLHVTTGAAVGAGAPSRAWAVPLGMLAHVAGDRMPHDDIPNRRFELWSGVTALLALAVRHGPLDRVTIGAVAASAPDLEHLVRLPRPGGRKLFPSHRFWGWHRAGGVPTWAQLLAAGVLLGLFLAPPSPRPMTGANAAGSGSTRSRTSSGRSYFRKSR